jgi:Ca2+-binding EF-hand superfamily protein
MFEKADQDRSGTINEKEFRDLLVMLDIHVSEEDANNLVMEVDTNNNGLIDWGEYVAVS